MLQLIIHCICWPIANNLSCIKTCPSNGLLYLAVHCINLPGTTNRSSIKGKLALEIISYSLQYIIFV